MAAQGLLCPICATPNTLTPHVDHCHKTGKVRGILCHRCNIALGMLLDNPNACLRAAVYLLNSPAANGLSASDLNEFLAEGGILGVDKH